MLVFLCTIIIESSLNQFRCYPKNKLIFIIGHVLTNIIVATIILMITQLLQMMLDLTVTNSAIVRGIAALGIGAAWLQLIFIIGRYPFRGGDFSIMYYNIVRKTARCQME